MKKIIPFLICLLVTSFGYTQQLVPQIPYPGNESIKVFSNSESGLMLSVENRTGKIKHWDMRTGLLLKNADLPKNDYGSNLDIDEGSLIWHDGTFCVISDYRGNQYLAKERSSEFVKVKRNSKILNGDTSTWKVEVIENGKTQLSNVKKGNLPLEIKSTHSVKYAAFDQQYRFVVLYNNTQAEVFDISSNSAVLINKISVAEGLTNIRVSDDFPFLFYANLSKWGVINFVENKILVEEKADYTNHFSGNGVFMPKQKALYQFRDGQLGRYDLISNQWSPIGTKLTENKAAKLHFPQQFLADLLSSPQDKIKKYNELLGSKLNRYQTSKYFDDPSLRAFYLTQPSVWEDIKATELKVFNAATKELEYETTLPIKEKEARIVSVVGNQLLLASSKSGSYSEMNYQLIDYKTQKRTGEFSSPKTENDKSVSLQELSKKGKYALFEIIDYPENTFIVVDTKSNKKIFEEKVNSFGIFATNENYLIYDKKGVSFSGSFEVFDFVNKKVISTINCSKELESEYIWTGFTDEEQNWLIIGTMKGNLYIWDLKNGSFIRKIEALGDRISEIYTDDKFIYAQSRVEVKIFEKNTGKLHLGMVCQFSDNADKIETFVYTKEGFYLSDRNMHDFVAFAKDEKSYFYDQFDLKYNRPDIVIEKISSISPELIDSYYKAYQKRIKKSGFTEEQLSTEFHIPESQIRNFEYIQRVDTKEITLDFSFFDSQFNIDRYNIWINEVPVYGINGKSLKALKLNSHSTQDKIILSAGRNIIKVSCINEKGAESYKQTKEINCTQDVKKAQKLYFVGIGINNYKEPGHNLKWCVKDIRDLSVKLKKNYGDNIYIDTLFDNQVTRENVLAIKKKLLQSDVNDKVIISFSGHGLLSQSYDYYLSTYDINFNKPEEGGLPYEDLEWLLDSIPARKKLLLMDACHSGEVDKEELLAINELNKKEGVKGFQLIYEYKPTVGMKNSFELMQELFSNVNKGTGATVISAAGGTQFAQESGDLQNGVFTFSILELMQENKEMKLSKLKTAVGKRVEELTNGLQKPTSRNETIENDWIVW